MSHTVYRFGDYTLDASARVLLHEGEPVSVAPKSFDCLVYLIEQRERAVGRDELISAVWGRVEVSDAVLAQTLRRARIAIGDSGSIQARVRTVPRFGYHWVAAVELATSAPVEGPSKQEGEPAAQSPVEAPGLPDQVPVPKARRYTLWMVLAALSALVLLGYLMVRHAAIPEGAEANGDKVLVAVMPVDIAGGDNDNAWVRLGIMDFIASRLRASGHFNVMPSNQMVALAGAGSQSGGPTASSVLQHSGARWVVASQMKEDGGQWRLQLVISGSPVIADIDVRAASVLDAAAKASAALLDAMGVDVDASRITEQFSPVAERIQRIDAALLDGKLDSAESLIKAAPPDQRGNAELRIRAGRLAFRQGRIDEADSIYSKLLAHKAELPGNVLAATYMGLGAVAVRRGEFSAAQEHYADALKTLGANGETNLVGQAYMGRGVAFGAQGKYDRADDDLGRARIYLARAGNALDAASVDVNLGLMARRRHRYAQSIDHFDRAIAIFRRDKVKDSLAAALLGKIQVQLATLDLAGARASSSQAWTIATGLDNPILVSRIALARASVLFQTGSLKAAHKVLGSFEPITADRNPALVLRARIALAEGNAKHAQALLEPLVDPDSGPLYEALPVYVLAVGATGQGDTRALAGIDPASLDDPADRLYATLARAFANQNRGDHAATGKFFQSAVEIAHQSGIPSEVVRAGTAQARFMLATGQLDKASAMVGELAPYSQRVFAVAAVTAALYRKLGETQLAKAAETRARELAGERDPDRAGLY